ncbi:MAG: GGDEF domain-containing response regulator [Gemmatimonadota bacterium]
MKILIAEDNLSDLHLLESLLKKWGYDSVSAMDGNEAWEILNGPDSPRLAVLDWMMPGMEGDEICRRVRKKEESEDNYTYLILITGKKSADSIVTGLEAGADDFILKPFDNQELQVRLRAGQRIVESRFRLLAAKQDLWVESRTDSLTGVLNRRAILALVKRELNRAKRSEKHLSLALVDIDHFKRLNDTHGHLAGDTVLRECVKRVRKAIRSYDGLGRIGGDELLVLFPGTGEAEALTICIRVAEALAERAVTFKDLSINFTVSQGLATTDGRITAKGLIELADQALYRAKEMGRNRVERSVHPLTPAEGDSR